MSRLRLRRLTSFLLAASAVVAACGGSDSSSSTNSRQRNVALTADELNSRRALASISASGESVIGISNDGHILQWGRVWNDEMTETTSDISIPITTAKVAANSPYTHIAISTDNKLVTWGMNAADLKKSPANLDLSTVTSLSTDGVTAYAIDTNKKLWGWGNLYDFDPNSRIPADVANLKIVEVATDSGNKSATVALDENGAVHVWGSNPEFTNGAAEFSGITAKHVYFIYNHPTVVTTDGKVIQVGESSRTDLFKNVDVDRIAADGFGNYLAVDTEGKLHLEKSLLEGVSSELLNDLAQYVDEYNEYSSDQVVLQLESGWGFFMLLHDGGDMSFISATWPEATSVPAYFTWKNSTSSISAANGTSFGVSEDYTIKAFHSLGDDAALPSGSDYVQVAAGWNHNLAMKLDGGLVSWGSGPNDNKIPAFEGDVEQIGAGYGFSAALTTYGNLYDWGTFYSPTQTKVARPSTCTSYWKMDVGFANVMALGEDCDTGERVLHIWGDNSYGQADIPEDLDIDNVWRLAITVDCAATLMYDGTIRAWGDCYGGIKDVPSEYTYWRFDLGFGFGVALGFPTDSADEVNADQVVVWGEGSTTDLAPPADLVDITQVVAGRSHILAMDYAGNVYAWGTDTRGETKVPKSLRSYGLPADVEPPKDNGDSAANDVRKRIDAAAVNSSSDYVALANMTSSQVENGAVVQVTTPTPEVVVSALPDQSKASALVAIPAAKSPGLTVGGAVGTSQVVTILGLTKVSKVSFVVPKTIPASIAKVCKITKTSVTAIGKGICDVKVSYTDSKKKARTKSIALIVGG